MVFKSTVSNLNKYVYIFIILFLLILTIPALFDENFVELMIISFIQMVFILFLFWTYKTTFYTIKESDLFWKSGPFHGKIDIKKINKIEHHNGILVPTLWKPALSHTGLIITYNKYDDIYISPEKQQEFIITLQQINSNITIKNTLYAL